MFTKVKSICIFNVTCHVQQNIPRKEVRINCENQKKKIGEENMREKHNKLNDINGCIGILISIVHATEG